MAAIDPSNATYISELEIKFWTRLRSALVDVLGVDGQVATDYREQLANAPSFEKLLALHDDPIDVAAALSGISLTEEHLVRYDDTMKAPLSTSSLSLIPRRLPAQPDWQILPIPLRQVLPRLVTIHTIDQNWTNGFVFFGSLIVTTAHSITIPGPLSVRSLNQIYGPASIVGIDESNDIALVSADTNEQFPPQNFRSAKARVGELVIVTFIGHDFGFHIEAGPIVAAPPDLDGPQRIRARIELEPRTSGAPVIDEKGQILGVVQGRDRSGATVIIPAPEVFSLLARSLNGWRRR